MATKKSSQYPYQWANGSWHSVPQGGGIGAVSIGGQPVSQAAYQGGALAGALTNPFGTFTPYTPPPIPAGYYDPNLDASRQSASRGLLYTEQDVGLQGRRAGEDYGLDPNAPSYAWSDKGQLERGFNRNTEDNATARQYTNEDYATNVKMLTRQYGQQARQQGEQARKYGVTSGGIALLSAAKRAENQGIDQTALDTGRNRALAGFDRTDVRLGEDLQTGYGKLQTGYDRGVADRGTTLSRGRSEDLFFGLDTDAQKSFQATQAGYQAPMGPSNEFVGPDGQARRTIKSGGVTYVVDKNGKILSQRRAA